MKDRSRWRDVSYQQRGAWSLARIAQGSQAVNMTQLPGLAMNTQLIFRGSTLHTIGPSAGYLLVTITDQLYNFSADCVFSE